VNGGSEKQVQVQTVLLSGTTDAPDGIQVVVKYGTQQANTLVKDGQWSFFSIPLPNVTTNFEFLIRDAANNERKAEQKVVYVAPPPPPPPPPPVFIIPPVLDVASAPYKIEIKGGATITYRESQPTISGTSDAEDQTVLELSLSGTKYQANVLSGNWSFRVPERLSDGNYPLVVTSRNKNGIASTATQQIWIIANPYSVQFDGGAVIQVGTVVETVSGKSTAPNGSAIILSRDTKTIQVLGTTTVQNGLWKVNLSTPLQDGIYRLKVKVMLADRVEAETEQVMTVKLQKLQLNMMLGGIVQVSNPTFSGTASVDSELSLLATISGQSVRTTAKNGKWSLIFAQPLAEGQHEFCIATVAESATRYSGKYCSFLRVKYDQFNHKKYFNGYPDRTFKPERAITRVEIAALLVRLIEQQPVDARPPLLKKTLLFKDVSNKFWGRTHISKVVQYGLMSGFAGNLFKPEQTISRAEVKAIVLKYMALTKKQSRDLRSTEELGKYLRDQRMLGAPAIFVSTRPTRAEMTFVLNRLFQRGPLLDVKVAQWTDVPTDHWAFQEVEEATRDHRSLRVRDGERLLP
jgi:hypothetical protein